MRRLLRLLPLLLLAAPIPLRAAEILILSNPAFEAGLAPALQNFRAISGQGVHITYAVGPRMSEFLDSGEPPHLLFASQSVLEALAEADQLAGAPIWLGRIGIGLAVRSDLPTPVVRDVAGLRRAVSEAQKIVFNRDYTGHNLEQVFEQLRLTSTVAGKALRFPTNSQVIEHLLRGSGQELGFGAITEIRAVRELRYAGPLPPEVQHYTTYGAALLPDGPAAAAALLRWLSGPEARAAFSAAGIEPPE